MKWDWIFSPIFLYSNLTFNTTQIPPQKIQERCTQRLYRFKPSQTTSNHLKPFETISNNSNKLKPTNHGSFIWTILLFVIQIISIWINPLAELVEVKVTKWYNATNLTLRQAQGAVKWKSRGWLLVVCDGWKDAENKNPIKIFPTDKKVIFAELFFKSITN